MATALLKVASGFVAGAGVGLVAGVATTGHAQGVQPPPRQQPGPRNNNAPPIPSKAAAPPPRPAAPASPPPARNQAPSAPAAPQVSNRTLQAQAKSQAAVAAAEAEARKAEAEAAKAKAEADAKAREAEAAAKAREAEEARKAGEAAAAAKRETDKLEREREKDSTGLMLTVGSAIIGVAALAAGLRGGGRFAAKAAESAAVTVKQVNALGREAAKINKAKKLVAGTPKGDQMAGIVKEANQLGRADNFATLGKPMAADKAATLLKVSGAVEIGASYALPAAAPALGMSQESADRAAQFARVIGFASVGGGLGLKLGMTGAQTVRPSAKAIASINAGAKRLAREGAGGAAKVSANKVGVEVARSSGKVRAAKSGASVTASRAKRKAVEAAGTVERAKVRTAKSVTAERKKQTYTRTYRRGPKAGTTETVTRH